MTMNESVTTKFFEIVAGGRVNTAPEWQDYLVAFHAEFPYANELFTLLQRFSGETSYTILANAAAATGALRVLDAGCGEGNLVDELLEKLSTQAHVTGIDINPDEIKICRDRYAGIARVTFDVGDARALPYPDASFECVAAHQFLNLFPDIQPVLSDVRRVLTRGGSLVFVANRGWRTDQSANWMLLHQAAMEVLKTMYPQFVWPRMGDMRVYREDGIAEIFTEAGGWDTSSLTIEGFNVGASMSPSEIAALYNHLYLFATIPNKKPVLEAVERRARELAVHDLVQIDLPSRLVRIRAK
jgi:ubiquinone/menaquinone biosynthesis C-methylase UbiE